MLLLLSTFYKVVIKNGTCWSHDENPVQSDQYVNEWMNYTIIITTIINIVIIIIIIVH